MEKKELKIELPADVAAGKYSNLAVISHSAQEFFVDFVTVAPICHKPRCKAAW